MQARPASVHPLRSEPICFDRSLLVEMAQSLCASNAISLDDDYAYEASDSQVEGSKDSDSDDSDDLPVVNK